jgi:hypothetical protein
VCGLQVTDTGLCLELNRAGLWRTGTGTGLCLELNRAGVRLAGNWYRFVFGTE